MPRTIFGGGTILCAILRMVILAWHVIWLRMTGRARFGTLVVDQVRAPLLPVSGLRK
jgi:hypothetical protein